MTQVKFRDASGALVKESNYTYDVFDRRLKAIDQVMGGATTTLKTGAGLAMLPAAPLIVNVIPLAVRRTRRRV